MPTNPILYVLAFLGVVILGLSIWLYVDHVELTAKAATITALTTENTDWAAKAKLANDNFNKILADDQAQQKRAIAAEATADAQNVAQMKLAAKLRALKAQPTDCTAAVNLINTYLGGR